MNNIFNDLIYCLINQLTTYTSSTFNVHMEHNGDII